MTQMSVAESKQYLAEVKADRLQDFADRLTHFRENAAPFVGATIATTSENWPVFALTAAVVATDMEGIPVRKADAIRGYHKQTTGAEDDPRADHKLTQAMFAGLAVRYLRNGDITSTTILAANGIVSRMRDSRMDALRERIKDEGLDADALKANRLNKVKMILQVGGKLALVSPLSRRREVRLAGLALTTLGTVSGLLGERAFTRNVEQLSAANHKN